MLIETLVKGSLVRFDALQSFNVVNSCLVGSSQKASYRIASLGSGYSRDKDTIEPEYLDPIAHNVQLCLLEELYLLQRQGKMPVISNAHIQQMVATFRKRELEWNETVSG